MAPGSQEVATPRASPQPSSSNMLVDPAAPPQSPEPNLPQPLPNSPNKRPPAEPHTRFNLNEKIIILMAIMLADERGSGKLDYKKPRAGFNDEFCDQVRFILRNHPNLSDRWRPATVKEDGKSPCDSTLRHIWGTFSTVGFPQAKHRAGKTKDQDKWDAIKTIITAGDHSMRYVAANVGCSLNLVYRVIHSIKMFWYKPPRGQSLTEQSIDRRDAFASHMVHQIEDNKFDPHNCAFTDEAYGGPNANKENIRFWRFKGQFHDWREKMITHKQHPSTAHVFVLLHYKAGIIGPYFVEDIPQLGPFDDKGKPIKVEKTLTADRYVWMLENWVIPELRDRLGVEDFAKCWWQQDGAPAHTAQATMEYLESVFGTRILSNAKYDAEKHAPPPWIDWPPYSPDLNPLDYFFWSHIRKLLFIRGVKSKKDIIDGLVELVPMVDLQFVRNAIDDFAPRLEALMETRGTHFEYMFKAFKLRRNAAAERFCPTCNSRHRCPCDDCKARCIARKMQSERREILEAITDPLERLWYEVDTGYVMDDDDNLVSMDID